MLGKENNKSKIWKKIVFLWTALNLCFKVREYAEAKADDDCHDCVADRLQVNCYA